MAPIAVMVVDDNESSRRDSCLMLREFPACSVDWETASLTEALILVQRVTPGLVFLCAELQQRSGIDPIRVLAARSDVAVVSAHSHGAVRAMPVHAVDYLLKPLARESVAALLARVLRRRASSERASVGARSGPSEAALAEGAAFWPPLRENEIAVDCGKTRRLLQMDRVVAVTSLGGNYTELLLLDGSTLVARRTFKEWEAVLPRSRFIRVHRGAIVNLGHLDTIARTRCGSLTLDVPHAPKQIVVSRRRLRRFNDALANHSAQRSSGPMPSPGAQPWPWLE